jgi:hypothetical protein
MYRRIAMLAAAAVLAGCAQTVSEPRYLVPPQASCPAVDPRRPVPASAPLAAEFQPISAAMCTFEAVAMTTPGGEGGGWAWRSVQRTEGSLDALVAALRMPPPRHRGDVLDCPAMAQGPMFLALTDASGQVVIPAIPADPCGFRLAEVDRAIEALAWVTIDTR